MNNKIINSALEYLQEVVEDKQALTVDRIASAKAILEYDHKKQVLEHTKKTKDLFYCGE